MEMKKRLLVLGCIAAMLVSSQAHAEEKDVQVLLDGKALVFEQSPVIENGTTLVPFRALFEQLGMKVEWLESTKTIKGSKEELQVELSIDQQLASVNGKQVILEVAPQLRDGLTFVPLRFVSEATGSAVYWNGLEKTVLIRSMDRKTETAALTALFAEMLKADQAENVDQLLSHIDPNSPLYGALKTSLKEQYEKFDILTTSEKLEIVSLQGDRATVREVQRGEKLKGGFFLNSRIQVLYTLTRQESGEWKVSNVAVEKIENLMPESFYEKEAAVTEQQRAAIYAVFEEQLKQLQAENVEGIVATLHPEAPTLKQSAKLYETIFKAYDLSVQTEKRTILDVTETEAQVYEVQTSKKLKGPDFLDNRTAAVHTLRKDSNGAWKFHSSRIIKTEPLPNE
jgi:hypothetical protein